MVVVLLLRLPGQARALVSEDVAELGERMGELRRLDPAPGATTARVADRQARSPRH